MMTMEDIARKYCGPQERIILTEHEQAAFAGEPGAVTWECAALEVCPQDPVYHMNIYGAEGWEPLRPVGRSKKAWLFKRPIPRRMEA